MKIIPLLTIALTLGSTALLQGQTYVYDFGADTGTHTSGVSETLLPAPDTGGGTARVRVGAGGGQFALENPGSASLGSGSELVITAPTGTSVNKFSIYDYDDATPAFQLSFSLEASGNSGDWILTVGDGASYSDNNPFNSNQTFFGLRLVGSDQSIDYRLGGNWVDLPTVTNYTSGAVYAIELFGNNSETAITYERGGTYSLAAGTTDLWIGGTRVETGLGKSNLAAGSAIDSFLFQGASSPENAGVLRLDNLTYGPLAVPEPSAAVLAALAAGLLGGRRKRVR